MSFALNHNRRWREARLFPDLTAAAIYTAAVSVVLISVLALAHRRSARDLRGTGHRVGSCSAEHAADGCCSIAFGIEAPFNVGDRNFDRGEKIEGTVVHMNWALDSLFSPTAMNVAIVPQLRSRNPTS